MLGDFYYDDNSLQKDIDGNEWLDIGKYGNDTIKSLLSQFQSKSTRKEFDEDCNTDMDANPYYQASFRKGSRNQHQMINVELFLEFVNNGEGLNQYRMPTGPAEKLAVQQWVNDIKQSIAEQTAREAAKEKLNAEKQVERERLALAHEVAVIDRDYIKSKQMEEYTQTMIDLGQYPGPVSY